MQIIEDVMQHINDVTQYINDLMQVRYRTLLIAVLFLSRMARLNEFHECLLSKEFVSFVHSCYS